MAKGALRFFFDYGAGGCLWAADEATRKLFGPGPVDTVIRGLGQRADAFARLPLSATALRLRDQLDVQHSGYLNPHYPMDPSLWSQALCDQFNADVARLLALLRQELAADFDIRDEQTRYAKDARLDAYLAEHPDLAALNEVETPTVGGAGSFTPPHP